MRLVMLGTGPFAVPTLRALAARGTMCVRVVTRPPRGRRAEAPPMQPAAEQLVLRCGSPRPSMPPKPSPSCATLAADLLVVCDYGEILKPAALARRAARRHQSARLAPAEVSRGGAGPMGDSQRRRGNGQHGHPNDAWARCGAVPGRRPRRRSIPTKPRASSKRDLSEQGAALVLKVVDELEAGTAQPQVQDKAAASKAPRLTKEDGLVDWSRSAAAIKNQVRALDPWPRAYTHWRRQGAGEPLRLILHRVRVSGGAGDSASTPGTVIRSGPRLVVAAGEGSMEILELTAKRQASHERAVSSCAATRWQSGDSPRGLKRAATPLAALAAARYHVRSP